MNRICGISWPSLRSSPTAWEPANFPNSSCCQDLSLLQPKKFRTFDRKNKWQRWRAPASVQVRLTWASHTGYHPKKLRSCPESVQDWYNISAETLVSRNLCHCRCILWCSHHWGWESRQFASEPGIVVVNWSPSTRHVCFAEKIVKTYRKLDALANSAGFVVNLLFKEQTLEHWDSPVDPDGWGTFFRR